jgi:hypothetical protein
VIGDIVDGESLKKIVFQTVIFTFTIMTSPYFPFKISKSHSKKKGFIPLLSKNSYDLQHNETGIVGESVLGSQSLL